MRECNLFEKNMKSCRKIFKRIFTTLLFIHLDFNQGKMPSGENELDRLGGTHPESKKKKVRTSGGHLNQVLEDLCRNSPQFAA